MVPYGDGDSSEKTRLEQEEQERQRMLARLRALEQMLGSKSARLDTNN